MELLGNYFVSGVGDDEFHTELLVAKPEADRETVGLTPEDAEWVNSLRAALLRH